MKRFVLLVGLIALLGAGLFAQNAALPKLAVVEFTPNSNAEKTKQDSLTVRNLVEAQMISSGKFHMISRSDIDKLLAEQKIMVSAISSTENIKKLQLQNISYIVTGSVDAIGEDYAVTVRVLDVSNGRFSHSADDFIGGGSRDLYNGVKALITNFIAGMGLDASGSIVQSQQSAVNIALNHYERGKAFFDRGDNENAIIELSEAVKLNSNMGDAYIVRSWAYSNLGNYDKGLSDANVAIKLNPQTDSAYFVRGLSYFGKNDFDKSISDLTQAIRLNTKLGIVYLIRGIAYQKKGSLDNAISDLSQAINYNTINIWLAYQTRAECYGSKDDFNKAISDYTQAIKLNKNYYLYYRRGLLYIKIDEDDKAISDFTQAIKIDQSKGQAYYIRGRVYELAKGDKTRANADYAKAKQLGFVPE